jgi:hypothetical protein
MAIASKPDGHDVAIEILNMRIFSERQEKRTIDPALIEAGRKLIQEFEFTRLNRNEDHQISSIIKACFSGDDGARYASALCRKFKAAVAGRNIYAFDHDRLLQSLFKVQPVAVLNAFFSAAPADQRRGVQMLLDVSHHETNPIDFVPSEKLLAWCDVRPQERYPLMAQVVTLYAKNGDGPAAGWSVTALAILEESPDSIEILKQFVRRFRPTSWSGSRAVAMEAYLPLLQTLQSHVDPRVAQFARAEEGRLKKEIDEERKRETRDDKVSDERFE